MAPHSSRPAAIMATLVVIGAAVGVIIYQFALKEKPTIDTTGFDISQIQKKTPIANVLPSRNTKSGLAMLETGGLGQMRFGTGVNKTATTRKEIDYKAIARANEAKISALAMRYTRRYPLVAQYGRDWMSYPDLKKLNDDYMRDHDPVAFLHGAARSKNFGKLAGQYATTAPIQNFVKEAMKGADGDATSAAASLMKDDGLVKDLVSNTASALGLPPALITGLSNSTQVDEKQIMGQIMQDPQLQKAMSNPGSGEKAQ
jgi:hypothetical protein